MTCGRWGIRVGALLALGAGPTARAAGAEPASADRVSVELVSTEPLSVLEHRPHALEGRSDLAGVDGWRALCVAPCRAELDRADGVRVGGSDAAPLYVALPDGAGPFTVYADPGSAPLETAGFTLILTGAGLLLAGAVTTLILATGPTKNAEDDSAPVIALHGSVTAIVLGAVVLGIGVPVRAAAGGNVRVERRPTAAAVNVRLELGGGLSLTPRGLEF